MTWSWKENINLLLSRSIRGRLVIDVRTRLARLPFPIFSIIRSIVRCSKNKQTNKQWNNLLLSKALMKMIRTPLFLENPIIRQKILMKRVIQVLSSLMINWLIRQQNLNLFHLIFLLKPWRWPESESKMTLWGCIPACTYCRLRRKKHSKWLLPPGWKQKGY